MEKFKKFAARKKWKVSLLGGVGSTLLPPLLRSVCSGLLASDAAHGKTLSLCEFPCRLCTYPVTKTGRNCAVSIYDFALKKIKAFPIRFHLNGTTCILNKYVPWVVVLGITLPEHGWEGLVWAPCGWDVTLQDIPAIAQQIEI